MYALIGANRHIGKLVLQNLLTLVPADQTTATTRAPEKLAEYTAKGVVVRHADFSDTTSLPAAFAGLLRLLVISIDIVGQRVAQHKAAITGVVAAGVSRIIYTSGLKADPNASHPILTRHGETEVALATSGVLWMTLRNNFYSEFLKDLVGLMLVNEKLLMPEGTSKHSRVTREDCARAAAGALVGKLADPEPVDVTGPEALNFANLVPYLSNISGHTVTAQVSPESEITAQIAAKGIPLRKRQASWPDLRVG